MAGIVSGARVIKVSTVTSAAERPLATSLKSRSLKVTIPAHGASAVPTSTAPPRAAMSLAARSAVSCGASVRAGGAAPPAVAARARSALCSRTASDGAKRRCTMSSTRPCAEPAPAPAGRAASTAVESADEAEERWRSRREIASYRHLAMSSMPTTAPCSSRTGRWRKRLSIMRHNASMALSLDLTVMGLAVMTSLTSILVGSARLAITRLVTSLSVRIPTRAPSAETTSPLSALAPSILTAASTTESSGESRSAGLGLSSPTVRQRSMVRSAAEECVQDEVARRISHTKSCVCPKPIRNSHSHFLTLPVVSAVSGMCVCVS